MEMETQTVPVSKYYGVVYASRDDLAGPRRAAAAERLARYRLRYGARRDEQSVFTEVTVTVDQPGGLFIEDRYAVVATARTVPTSVGWLPPPTYTYPWVQFPLDD